ncbi:hypothetical protein TNCV_5008451 [Trichonephila clavipes]|nr:hypothetical protein TNCV_5008451 [Trichonephila clavipes]
MVNDDNREEITDFVQSVSGFQECDEEDVETWMTCDEEDCRFQMRNDDEIMTSVQEESDPVDDETRSPQIVFEVYKSIAIDLLPTFALNPPVSVVWKLRERGKSSDVINSPERCSKLRDPPPSPRVVSFDVN